LRAFLRFAAGEPLARTGSGARVRKVRRGRDVPVAG